MKVTQLIEKLQRVKEKHGDVNIALCAGEIEDETKNFPKTTVAREDEIVGLFHWSDGSFAIVGKEFHDSPVWDEEMDTDEIDYDPDEDKDWNDYDDCPHLMK